MTRFKKLIVNLIVIAMILAQCSTVSFAASKVPTVTPTVKKGLTIKKGKTTTIKVKANGSYIISKTFTSSKKSVVKVTNKKTGKIKAMKAGNCKIKVTVKYRKTKKGSKKTKTWKIPVKVKKAATVTPTPDTTATPDATTTPTTTPDDNEEPDDDEEYIEYPDYDPNDLKALQDIVTAQKAAGAEVDSDKDSPQYFWGDKGRLESIDWSECKLSGKLNLSGLTGLLELKCAKNDLTALDVSKNIVLTDLECHGNSFTTLDVSKNTVLESLSCDEDVTIKGAPKSCVIILEDTYNRSDMKALKEIIKAQQKANPNTGVEADLDDSQYSWSNEGRLEEINWSSCDLTGSIVLTPFTELTHVTCDDNALTSLDVKNCKLLEELQCQENQLTTLTLTGCSKLETLNCSENKLSKLTLSDCKALLTLDCHANQLSSLTISSNTLLEELDCSENKIKSLSLSKNTELNDNDNVTCDEGTTISGHYITKDDEHTKDDCNITFVAK